MRALRALLLALALVPFAACEAAAPPTRLASGEAEMVQVTRRVAPEWRFGAAAIPGDVVLSSRGVRVLVGGMNRNGADRGAVLAASAPGVPESDGIIHLAPLLYIDNGQAKVEFNRIGLVLHNGTPVLRMEGTASNRRGALRVTHDLALSRVAGGLSMATHVTNERDEPVPGVRFAARVAWGGLRAFVPGTGPLETDGWQTAEWIGTEGRAGSTAFAFIGDSMAVNPTYDHRTSARLLQHTDLAASRAERLAPRGTLRRKSVLMLAPLGLSAAVRRIGFVSGRPWPEVWVRVPERPPGTSVVLVDEGGRPLMRGRPDEFGRVVLPLLARERGGAARFGAYATAFGHASSELATWSGFAPAVLTLPIPKGGQARVRVRDTATGEPLPARIRITPVGAPEPLNLGPDHSATGAGDTVVSLGGEADIPLPAGLYRIVASHGPEWSVSESTVRVSDSFSPLVEAKLARQIDAPDWVACDLHLHAAPSPDSQVSLADRLVTLAAEGVAFAVPTDHNHVTDYAEAHAALGLKGLETMTGVEITTEEPVLGHFNAYPFPANPDLPGQGAPPWTAVVPSDLFAHLHSLDPDMVVQINHPRAEGGIGYFDVLHLDTKTGAADEGFSADFDAIEVFNGFDLARQDLVEAVFNDWLALLKRGKRVVATGSSDSHTVRYQLAGYPRTYAHVPAEETGGAPADHPRSVVRAIKAGASFVTSGPFLEANIAGAAPGATVSAATGEAQLSVRVRVTDWIAVDRLEVFVGGERVVDTPIRPTRMKASAGAWIHTKSLDLEVQRDTFVVVRVSGKTPIDTKILGRADILPLAFTNPIFVDTDGDGKTPWSR